MLYPATSSRPLKQDGCISLRLGGSEWDNQWSVFILIKNSEINVYLRPCLWVSLDFSIPSFLLSSCHPLGIISESPTILISFILDYLAVLKKFMK